MRRFSAPEAAAHFCPPSRSRDRCERLEACIRRLWQGDACEVHECPSCSFGFGWPFVGGDGEFYAIMHEMAWYPARRWEFAVTIERVLAVMPSGRIFDIGAGTGQFLDRVPPAWERWALETSAGVCATLRQKGYSVVGSTEEAAAHVPERFDVLTMFQVLEHVARFADLLEQCRDLLRPDGRLVISVPDGRRVREQEEITGCADMPPNHINRWTPQSLGMALEDSGFVVVEQIGEPPGMRTAVYRASLKVRAAAARNPRSMAARVFGIRSRAIRLPLQVALSGLAMASMLHRLASIRAGQSLMTVARPR